MIDLNKKEQKRSIKDLNVSEKIFLTILAFIGFLACESMLVFMLLHDFISSIFDLTMTFNIEIFFMLLMALGFFIYGLFIFLKVYNGIWHSDKIDKDKETCILKKLYKN